MEGEILSIDTAKHIADLEKKVKELEFENAMNKENAEFKMVDKNGAEIKLTASELISRLVNDNNLLSSALNDCKNKINKACKYVIEHSYEIYSSNYRNIETGALELIRKTPIVEKKLEGNPDELLIILGGDINDSR